MSVVALYDLIILGGLGGPNGANRSEIFLPHHDQGRTERQARAKVPRAWLCTLGLTIPGCWSQLLLAFTHLLPSPPLWHLLRFCGSFFCPCLSSTSALQVPCSLLSSTDLFSQNDFDSTPMTAIVTCMLLSLRTDLSPEL